MSVIPAIKQLNKLEYLRLMMLSREGDRREGILLTNQGDVALQACLRGLGVGAFLSYQVAEALAAGTLRRVLEDFEPAPRQVHVVRPQGRLLPLRVRTFVDFVVPRLRERLAAKVSRSSP